MQNNYLKQLSLCVGALLFISFATVFVLQTALFSFPSSAVAEIESQQQQQQHKHHKEENSNIFPLPAEESDDQKNTKEEQQHPGVVYKDSYGKCHMSARLPLDERPDLTNVLKRIPYISHKNIYSTFWCTEESSDPASSVLLRACTFRNACFRTNDSSFVLHLPFVRNDQTSLLPFVDVSKNKVLYRFPSPFITTAVSHAWDSPSISKGTGITPIAIKGPIITDASKVQWINDNSLTTLHTSLHPKLQGKVLVEDLLAVDDLNELFKPVTKKSGDYFIVLGNDRKDIDTSNDGNSDSNNNNNNNFKTMMKSISGHNPLFLNDLLANAKNENDELVCFEHLNIGSGRFEIDSRRITRPMDFLRIRNRLLKTFNLESPPQRPTKCQITLISNNNHDGYNVELDSKEIKSTLSKEFPDCDFKYISTSPKLSLLEKMKLISKTTILVTPCGDISLFALFLPRYSEIIEICGAEPDTGRVHSTEDIFWKWFSYFTSSYYPIESDELVSPVTASGNGNGNGNENENENEMVDSWPISWKEGWKQSQNCKITDHSSLKEYYLYAAKAKPNPLKLSKFIRIALARSTQMAF